jgi:hypothetical protein
MRSTEAEVSPAGEDQAYFLVLEQGFLRQRGSATLLSAADWQVAREWRHAGIPAELVLEVMAALFARQRERAPKRSISSLRYFRAAVAAAWDEALALRAGGHRVETRAEPTVGERLAALSRSLPAELPAREELAAAIVALSGPVEVVEPELARLDAATLAKQSAALDAEARAAIDAEVGRALAPLAGRLSMAARQEARSRLRNQALRRRVGLPLLSLFAPEAMGDPEV